MHDGNLINHVASPPATQQKATMTEPRYPSWARAERARQKRLERQREAELLRRVNERLAALGIDWKQLMLLVAEDRVEVVVKSDVIPE
jgi:hypothetical protein